jgi:hypothetical protein
VIYFGEMGFADRHSDEKARSKLADQGNTVIYIGYYDHHEKDHYKVLNIHTKKPIFSKDVIWLNKTYSQHIGITQVASTASEEEEVIVIEDN